MVWVPADRVLSKGWWLKRYFCGVPKSYPVTSKMIFPLLDPGLVENSVLFKPWGDTLWGRRQWTLIHRAAAVVGSQASGDCPSHSALKRRVLVAGPPAPPRTPIVTPSAVCGSACCPWHSVGGVLLVPDVLHPTDLIEVLDEGVVRHVVWQVGLVVRLVVWVRLVIAAVSNSCKNKKLRLTKTSRGKKSLSNTLSWCWTYIKLVLKWWYAN